MAVDDQYIQPGRAEVRLPDPVSASVALAAPRTDVEVPDDDEVLLGPESRGMARHFQVVRPESFDDLKALGLVPSYLEERPAVDALRADERAALKTARRLVESSGGPHECACEGHGPQPTYRQTLDRTYRQVRSTSCEKLVGVLQDGVSDTLDWRHPLVTQTARRLRRWVELRDRWWFGMFVLNDITVGDRATLAMHPTVNVLHANDITIGKNGTLRFLSGGIKVRCNALNGPTLFDEIATHVVGASTEPRLTGANR